MIIVVGGIKGGTGKTTIATNLIVCRASTGKKVLLVDADEQCSASDWADQRVDLKLPISFVTIKLCGKGIHSQLEKLRHDFSDIIVDVGGGGRDTQSQRSALGVADLMIIPVKPRSLDVWTLGATNNILSEMQTFNDKLNGLVVINQADSVGSDNSDASNLINTHTELKLCPHMIGNRKAFSNAASEGLGVIELNKSDPKAINEMNALCNFIWN